MARNDVSAPLRTRRQTGALQHERHVARPDGAPARFRRFARPGPTHPRARAGPDGASGQSAAGGVLRRKRLTTYRRTGEVRGTLARDNHVTPTVWMLALALLAVISACRRAPAPPSGKEPASGRFGSAAIAGRVRFRGAPPEPPHPTGLGSPDCARFA